MNWIIWIITSILAAVFIYFFLVPYIQDKIIFWQCERMLRKLAKGKSPEDAKQINEAADLCKQIRKETKL